MSKISQPFAICKGLLLTSVQRIVTTKNLRIMKITAFCFLLALCLNAGVDGYTQTVTMSVKNEPLNKVLAEIQRQTGVDLVYKWEMLQKAKPIDLEVKEATLKETLDICFKEQPLSYNIIENTIVISKKGNEGNNDSINQIPLIDVTGRLNDENGKAIAEVRVLIKGVTKIPSLSIDIRSTDINKGTQKEIKLRLGARELYDSVKKDTHPGSHNDLMHLLQVSSFIRIIIYLRKFFLLLIIRIRRRRTDINTDEKEEKEKGKSYELIVTANDILFSVVSLSCLL
jgi:hypothetical protein